MFYEFVEMSALHFAIPSESIEWNNFLLLQKLV